MAGWLRFIDKADYQVSKFMQESGQTGVALPVSLETLRSMEWNDRIALMQVGAVGLKSTVMFAEFPLEKITGLSAEAVKGLVEKFPSSLYDLGGDRIIRKNIALDTGFAYAIDARLREVAEILIDMDVIFEVGVPMIACAPDQIVPIDKPFPMFRHLLYQTEYRRFDIAGAKERMIKQRDLNRKRRPHLDGEWEPDLSQEVTTLEPFSGDIESAHTKDLTSYIAIDTL